PWPTFAHYGLAMPITDDSFAEMKALVTFIAIAAVSVAGAGVYYVSSTSEPVVQGQGSCGGGQKAPWHCGYNVTIQ
ncbi:hypothetical protein OAF50_03800, partial [bacterium]|nr:hypothetical protein [bacterium]